MADGNPVTVREIDVPFWRIVVILMKWTVASIPAMIVLTFLATLIAAFLAVIMTAIGVQAPPTPPSP
jgi:hypothetical protein